MIVSEPASEEASLKQAVSPAAADPGRDELLHALLHERDVPCPLCAYNLRNLTGNRCPECGGELQMQVGLVEPRLRAYITLLTACCVGLGGSGLFAIVALSAAPGSWWRKTSAFILIAELVITAALLPFILASRTRFRRLSPIRQRELAFLMCLLVALLSAAFVLTFRER